jgi:hypothetical protein
MRNILAEMPMMPRAKDASSAIIGMAPPRSRSPPRPIDEYSIQTLHQMEFPIIDKFSVMVSVMDELADALIMSGDREAALAATVIQGEYGSLTTMFNGRPVWKQLQPAAPSVVQLYLYYLNIECDGGWYITDSIMNADNLKDDAANRYAWMEGDGIFPGNVHVPYWKKKSVTGIDIEPLVWFLGKRVVMLQSMMLKSATDTMSLTELAADSGAEAMDIASDAAGRVAEGEERLAEAYARIEELESRIEVLEADESVPPTPKASGKGESKSSKNVTKSHGGWAPKMAKLINAIFKKDWKLVKQLCDMHYKSDIIKMLCEKANER